MAYENEVTSIPLNYDLGDVNRSEGSENLPIDNYLVKLTKIKFLPAKETENGHQEASVMLVCKVMDAQTPANCVYKGANYVTFLSLKDTLAWRMAQFMDAVYGRKATGRELNLADLQNRDCVIQLDEDTWKGNTRIVVGRYRPVGEFRKGAATAPATAKKPAPTQQTLPGSNGQQKAAPATSGGTLDTGDEDVQI